MQLTDAQAKFLLNWHAHHDAPRMSKWNAETINKLTSLGLLETVGNRLVVTTKGATWCFENHLNYAY